MTQTTQSTGFRIERADGIATVILDRPPLNTIDPDLIEALIAGLPAVLDDPAIRCVVVTGTGRAFVGGADITVMRRLDPVTYRAMRRWVVVQKLLEHAPKPVLGALNGHALGGGAELALACDLRILNDRATFGFPEIGLGIFPGAGGSQRLARMIGVHRAKRLIIDGTRLTADQALSEGLVDMIAAPDEFDSVVAREARRLADLPTATVGLVKHAVHEGIELPLEEALELEGRYVLANLELADAAEGLQAFLDKRSPRFSGS